MSNVETVKISDLPPVVRPMSIVKSMQKHLLSNYMGISVYHVIMFAVMYYFPNMLSNYLLGNLTVLETSKFMYNTLFCYKMMFISGALVIFLLASQTLIINISVPVYYIRTIVNCTGFILCLINQISLLYISLRMCNILMFVLYFVLMFSNFISALIHIKMVKDITRVLQYAEDNSLTLFANIRYAGNETEEE